MSVNLFRLIGNGTMPMVIGMRTSNYHIAYGEADWEDESEYEKI